VKRGSFVTEQPYVPTGTAGQTTTVKRRTSVPAVLATILALVVLAALIVFVVQNGDTTRISYFGWDLDLALGLSLLLAAVLGFILGILTSAILRLRRRRNHTTEG
jgi:uncharacterized integral membrane protein